MSEEREMLPVATTKRSLAKTQNNYPDVKSDSCNDKRLKTVVIENAPALIDLAADNLPKIIDMASDIIDIIRCQKQTEATIALMREKGEQMQIEADIFIKMELTRRQSQKGLNQDITAILHGLTSALERADYSDEIKKEIIRVFDNAIGRLIPGSGAYERK